MEIMLLAKKIFILIKKFAFCGNKFYCPLCHASYSRFFPAGTPSRIYAKCPGCGSLERHRLLTVCIDKLAKQGILKTRGRLLHVAPESCLTTKLNGSCEYISIDMHSSEVAVRADISALCFPDECFDVIICNHVLEHVQDDRRALSELFRVLKNGGWGSIQVPMIGSVTQEDSSITDLLERERRYGQSDHVRQYGEDFKDRLQAAGFDVIELRAEEFLDQVKLRKLSVSCEKSVILVRKFETPVNTVGPL